jgi:hypothetical protein
MALISKSDISLAREIAVPDPEKGYLNAEYSLALTVQNGSTSASISTRPYRLLKDGTRRYAPDVLNQSFGFSSSSGELSKLQADLVDAISTAVEALVNAS